jgi:hypothetical protein
MSARRTAALALGAAMLLAAGLPRPVGADTAPKFTETKWPFELDQWGRGKAFRCGPENCGVEVNVYIRAKIGFCNCTTGVSDDAELDRVGDMSLMSDRFNPVRAGEPVKVGWMNGRRRMFDVAPPYAFHHNALSVAFNDHCDVIVAVVTSGHDVPHNAERAALAFLNSGPVLAWAKHELGL